MILMARLCGVSTLTGHEELFEKAYRPGVNA
jgi:hypothetical protein